MLPIFDFVYANLMKIFRVLFIAIIVMSFVELYVLIAVGSILGAFPTILLIIASAGLGSHLLREQGIATWQRFQETLARQEVPGAADCVGHGA